MCLVWLKSWHTHTRKISLRHSAVFSKVLRVFLSSSSSFIHRHIIHFPGQFNALQSEYAISHMVALYTNATRAKPKRPMIVIFTMNRKERMILLHGCGCFCLLHQKGCQEKFAIADADQNGKLEGEEPSRDQLDFWLEKWSESRRPLVLQGRKYSDSFFFLKFEAESLIHRAEGQQSIQPSYKEDP